MIHIVEEAFNIYVYNKVQMLPLYHAVALGNRIFRRPVRSEPVAPVIKLGFTDRLQDLQNALLYQPVKNRGDSERTGFSIWFWNFDPPHRLGLVPCQFTLDTFDILFSRLFFYIRYTFTICARSITAAVALDIPIRKHDVFL